MIAPELRRVCVSYLVLGGLLWPVPLLNVLQVESSAVVALVAFFVAGWAAVRRFRREGTSFLLVLGGQEAALLIPLVFLLTAQAWAPNCTVGQGLLFYGLFPGVTVVLAVTVAYALTGTDLSRPFLVFFGLGMAIVMAGPLYDLGLHPQFYTYNHVFGGVLGPIYDEQLAVRVGLFSFRGLTVLWAALAVFVGLRLRGLGPRWAIPLCALGIGLIYWFSAPLGMNTSAERIQDELGGTIQTPHFDVYYDSTTVGPEAVRVLADAHEAHYDHLRDRLDLNKGEGPDRIASYLYPNGDVKARLTGARATSVAPVWLRRPQVHLLRDHVDASLGHELAHVFSRPYGLPLIRASWAPGLIEGWAVALEPADPSPSAHDLVSVAATADTASTLSVQAEALVGRLTPWGFWTGRGAVSYATMGSFARYLLDTYGADRLKRVYARGNFRQVYGRSVSGLAEEWADFLRRRPTVARGAHDVVARRFTRPSLFEKECPHFLPPARRHLQAAERAERRRDSNQVETSLRAALAEEPQFVPAHVALAKHRLAQGKPSAVRRQLDTLEGEWRPASLRVVQADAHAWMGDSVHARRLYREAMHRIYRHRHRTRVRLLLRVAVADRPAVVEVLAGGDSAHVQARTLARVAELDGDPEAQAWQALRFQDAHRYAPADSVWQRLSEPLLDGFPRGERTEAAIQQSAWASRAAYFAGRRTEAGTLARQAAEQAGPLGATAWAQTLAAWAERAAGSMSETARGTDNRSDRRRFGPGTSRVNRVVQMASVSSVDLAHARTAGDTHPSSDHACSLDSLSF